MSKTRPNWLLRALVGVSLGIHLVIFMHVSRLYRANMLSCMELTLQDISKPPARSIPRPRQRPKTPPQPRDVKAVKVAQIPVPYLRPVRIEAADKDLPDSLVEGISIPDISATAGPQVANWSAGGIGAAISGDYTTTSAYLEMVKLKIERHKRYPDMARIRQIEGRVTIRFVITPEGSVRAAQVVKSSRHRMLDTAALRAVQDAAPFPKPPARFFKGEIPLELTIVFELT